MIINTGTLQPFTAANSGFNTGRMYYRNYSINRQAIPGKNNSLLGISGIQFIPEVKGLIGVNAKFQLKTIYPGLLSGSGYLHEVKKDEEAFKLGFFFDHVTGMPVIPGTGVKGAIRNAFPGFSDLDIQANFTETGYDTLPISNHRKQELKDILPHKKNKAAFIFCLIHNQQVDSLTAEQLKDIHLIEKEIFESKNRENKPINLYKRDIFHDSVPVGILNNYKVRDQRLFGSDYITPHKHKSRPELDPFANPEPIKFLKVMPNVVYEFRFKLNSGILTADNKKLLFSKILETLGIGAKTNVGYGQFHNSSVPNNNDAPQQYNPGAAQNPVPAIVAYELRNDEVFIEFLKKDPSSDNNKIVKIISDVPEKGMEFSIRYPSEFPSGKLVAKVIKDKKTKKIQSLQFLKAIN